MCKMLNDFCANRDFYCLDSSKQQNSKLLVKEIEVKCLLKSTAVSKLVCLAVCFKVSPITCETKIADGVQCFGCLLDIINLQTSLLKSFYLLFRGYGLISITYSHKQKMSRWVRCSNGKRAGIVDAKIQLYF